MSLYSYSPKLRTNSDSFNSNNFHSSKQSNFINVPLYLNLHNNILALVTCAFCTWTLTWAILVRLVHPGVCVFIYKTYGGPWASHCIYVSICFWSGNLLLFIPSVTQAWSGTFIKICMGSTWCRTLFPNQLWVSCRNRVQTGHWFFLSMEHPALERAWWALCWPVTCTAPPWAALTSISMSPPCTFHSLTAWSNTG